MLAKYANAHNPNIFIFVCHVNHFSLDNDT